MANKPKARVALADVAAFILGVVLPVRQARTGWISRFGDVTRPDKEKAGPRMADGTYGPREKLAAPFDSLANILCLKFGLEDLDQAVTLLEQLAAADTRFLLRPPKVRKSSDGREWTVRPLEVRNTAPRAMADELAAALGIAK